MATFGQYFHSVYPDKSSKARLRSSSDKREIPLLSKNRVNRVLVYPGSFNPPHVGHLSVLRHAFESSPDLNIVAGIIRPMPVEHIKGKNFQSGRCLVLSEKQRLELWKRDVRFPAWAFALKSTELREEIANAAKKDGYEILYIGLGGPDIWDFRSPYRHVCRRYAKNLISNAARRASFLGPDGVPQPFNGYTTWQRLELDFQPGPEHLQRTKRLSQTFKLPRLVTSVVGAVSAKKVEVPDLSPSDDSEDPMSKCSSTASSTTVTEDSTSNSSIESQSYFPVVR
jgi:Cytidylyltransferase-like